MRLPWTAALFLVVLTISSFAGTHQDYENHYLPGWEAVLGGENPWSSDGGHGFVYGPLFNAFALLVVVHPLLPKYLFAFCWFAAGIWYLEHNAAGPLSRRWLQLFWFCSPLFWVEIVHYGHFDIVLAALCVAVLISAERERDIVAGIGLGLGTLIKFYPLVMLPAVAVRERRLRWGVILGFFGTIATGCVIAYILWGPEFLNSFRAATEKASKHHSIFRFLRGEFSPTPDLDVYANATLVVALVASAIAGWMKRLPMMVHAYAMLMTVFTFYAMSNVQYILVLIALAPLIATRHFEELRDTRNLVVFWTLYAIWITTYQVLYWLHHDFTRPPWVGARDIAGAITFPLALSVLWMLFKTEWNWEFGASAETARRYDAASAFAPARAVSKAQNLQFPDN